MPRVRFLEEFDFHVPGKPVTVAYKRGWTGLVVTPCAVEAIAKGRAVEIEVEDLRRKQAEARVLAIRGSYDAPGFDACVDAELAEADISNDGREA